MSFYFQGFVYISKDFLLLQRMLYITAGRRGPPRSSTTSWPSGTSGPVVILTANISTKVVLFEVLVV